MPPDNLRGNCQVICGFHIMMEGDLMGDCQVMICGFGLMKEVSLLGDDI